MPEYAETELMANELNLAVSGCRVVSVFSSEWFLKRRKSFDHLEQLISWKIHSIERIGRALLFSFYHHHFGHKYLGNRLGSSGRWRIFSEHYDWKSLRGWAFTLIVQWNNDRIALVYTDSSRTSKIELQHYVHQIDSLRVYGPDIRSSKFTIEWVRFCCSLHSMPIKALLLEQKYFAGLSNWMVSEILFSANLNPFFAANCLTKDQISKLFTSIHLSVNNAIAIFRTNQKHQLNVYNRHKKPCYVCGAKIKKEKINRRSVYWCIVCQH